MTLDSIRNSCDVYIKLGIECEGGGAKNFIMGESYIYGFCLQLQIRLRELSDSEDTLETIKKLLQMEVRGPGETYE